MALNPVLQLIFERKNHLISFTILLIVIIIISGEAIDIPSDKGRKELSHEIQNFLSSGDQNYGSIKNNDYVESPIIINNRYIQTSDDPVQVKKFLDPLSKSGYHVGDIICILVEVIHNRRTTEDNEQNIHRNIEDIYIQEAVDNDLDIINISKNCYKLYTLEDINSYKNNYNCDSNYVYANEDNHIFDITTYKGDYLCSIDNYSKFNNNKFENFLNTGLNINFGNNTTMDSGRNWKIMNFDCQDNNSKNVTLNYNELSNEAYLSLDNSRYDLKIVKKNSSEEILDIYDVSNDFNIFIDKLMPKERIVYKYYVKPKKDGIFNALTTVRLSNAEYNDYPDIEYPMDIEILDVIPQFEVNLRLNKLHVLKSEKLNITYEIIYNKGCTDELDDVGIRLDDTKEFCKYISKNNDTEDCNLSFHMPFIKGSPLKIQKYIRYGQDGVYSLPGIWINGEHFTFSDEKVLVDTKSQRYHEIIAVIIMLIGVIIGEIYGENIRKSTESHLKKWWQIVLIIATPIIVILFIYLYILD